MRILVTTLHHFADVPGGMERLASDLAREYARRGHEVFVLAQAGSGKDAGLRDADGLHLLRYHLAPPRVLDVRRHERHFAEVRRLLKEFLPAPPDVIHGHDLLLTCAATDFFGGGVRCVYTIHSPTVEELPIAWRSQGLRGRLKEALGLPVIRRLEGRMLAGAAGLAAKSEFTRSRIRHHYGADIARRIRVIRGWVDVDRFRPTEDVAAARLRLGWPPARTVFFALRRLVPRMGLENLLAAAAAVRRQGLDFQIAVGGDGPLRDSLRELRDALGLGDRVAFMGRIPDELLPLAYGACDAAIMPTERLEGFGIPILEAMSCGRPVLVTPVGAMGEIVGPFEPRWIARDATAAGIAASMSAFLGGRLPGHAPESIRSHVRDHYAPEIAYAKYAEMLHA